jgi:hypothetical protein
MREVIFSKDVQTSENTLEFPIVDEFNVHLKDGQWLLMATPSLLENTLMFLIRDIFYALF